MTGRFYRLALIGLVVAAGFGGAERLRAQVFTVGEKTATADVDTEFHPTRVELPDTKMSERGRRELVRDLEAEQGFAHRILPLGATVTLQANGNLTPGAEEYKKMLYQKGTSAGVGDRVAVTSLEFKPDRILIDLNGGPYAKHRFMRHIQISAGPMASSQPNLNDGQTATGCRVTLVFEGGVPDISAPEVKALLYPLVDFSVKTGEMAYADTLPPAVKQAIATHDVLVGMNRRMVLAALGAPETKVRERNEDGQDYEEWIYGHQPQTMRFVRFIGDRVTLLKIAAMGKPMEIHDQDEMAAYMPTPEPKGVVEGDPTTAQVVKKGPPTLTRPGETLPDVAVAGTQQNGKVQFPTEKKPDPPPTAPAAPQNFRAAALL